ncbi:EVE domain-containing protein [Streptomyces poonensis]|nr:EVE domain-containing protein [Streptomyces poonensis]
MGRHECLSLGEHCGEGGTVEDWVYILNPNKDTLDGEPSTKETMLRLAKEEPELALWLSRRNRMSRGDRLWVFFSHPESAVAAMAEVDGEPYADPEDPDFGYLVDATLLPEATDALYRNPVGRDELGLRQVRSVQKVKPEALEVLLTRAGL